MVVFISSCQFTYSIAKAETCPSYDLGSIFDEEFFPDIKWDTSIKPTTLTWSTNVTAIKDIQISRPFSADELTWLQISFDAWDMALETITFERVTDSSKANIVIGLTPLQNNGFWTVEIREKVRISGTIRISSTTPIILTREGFIEVAQSEIGNLLGLGDIQKKMEGDSVMLDPDLPPFGEPVLNDFDIALVRQFYGESTCKSAWPTQLIEAKQDWANAKAMAVTAAQTKADAEAKAKAQAEADAQAKARAEAEAKVRAELNKRRTITCIKGAKKVKVTAVNPKCPRGFKQK